MSLLKYLDVFLLKTYFVVYICDRLAIYYLNSVSEAYQGANMELKKKMQMVRLQQKFASVFFHLENVFGPVYLPSVSLSVTLAPPSLTVCVPPSLTVLVSLPL